MSKITQNLKEMERLAMTLAESGASPETKLRISLLLNLFAELTLSLSDELTELEELRRFIESQGLSDNLKAFRKLGGK